MKLLAVVEAAAGAWLDAKALPSSTPKISLIPSSPSPILTIQGHILDDQILHLGPIHKDTAHNKGEGALTPQEMAAVARPHMTSRKLAIRYAPDPYAPTGQPLEEAFWRTLVGDTDYRRPADAHLGLACRVWERIVVAQCLADTGVLDEDLIDETNGAPTLGEMRAAGQMDAAMQLSLLWNSNRVMCCAGRAFCITKKGYMAMVPLGTEKGMWWRCCMGCARRCMCMG
ncbi:hypothetical protein B0T25DRAFT_631238 [Lasiosphaeria hispida]|uniref:Uncharacterized protein n=1 Tax=Lasiosphaeria hispida TaxID=260671 RepID=A0AAJ0HHG6_9PEZI|nr:hypothetical protein B0T25DRAFT_631238 [Lasiosphaeria hispida]